MVVVGCMVQLWRWQLDFIWFYYQPKCSVKCFDGFELLREVKVIKILPKLPDIRERNSYSEPNICFSTNLKLITANGLISLLAQWLRVNQRQSGEKKNKVRVWVWCAEVKLHISLESEDEDGRFCFCRWTSRIDLKSKKTQRNEIPQRKWSSRIIYFGCSKEVHEKTSVCINKPHAHLNPKCPLHAFHNSQ